jgi:hypothetical protein
LFLILFLKRNNKEVTIVKHGEFDSDFPIGHFNAEEAAQKIKNAVGVSLKNNVKIFNMISYISCLLRLEMLCL